MPRVAPDSGATPLRTNSYLFLNYGHSTRILTSNLSQVSAAIGETFSQGACNPKN
jgi:hypothetical protein